jgi:hypothetical protein
MKTYIFPVTFFLTCAITLFSSQVVYGKVYKLVDESGNIYFSDKVPPENTKYRRETLSKTGKIVDVTEQEKTKEQQEQEKRLNLLRKKQEKIMQIQKAHDDALLRSYHSKEEMLTELQTKTQTIESQRKLIESELAHKLQQLDTKQKSAATFERNAQVIPPNLIAEIKKIQDDIEQTKQIISENLEQQKNLAEEYDANIKRFLVLNPSDDSTHKNQIASIKEASALGLFSCENDDQCKKAWAIALVFVNTYSTTPPSINTDEVVMHALPIKDDDFSLSIAKIASKNDGVQLFLDIYCRDSLPGKELCDSPKIKALRASFRAYVNERLNNSVPTP